MDTAETLDRILVSAEKYLVACLLRTPLHYLASFLGYAARRLPELAKGLNAALEDEVNRKGLVATALRTPFGDLATFLDYAARRLPKLSEGLRTALEDEANRKELAATALRTPFDGLTSFLGYAERPVPGSSKQRLPELAEALKAALEEDQGATQLAKSAIEESPSALVGLLEKQPAISRMMLTRIDTARWNQVRSVGTLDPQILFQSLPKPLRRAGGLSWRCLSRNGL